MKRTTIILAFLLAMAVGASAQYAYSSTSISQTSGTIYASVYVEVDYLTADYYWIATWNELDKNCNFYTCAYPGNTVSAAWSYGASSTSWSASAPLSYSEYVLYAAPEVITYYYYDNEYDQPVYEDEYGYSYVNIEGCSPNGYEYAPNWYAGLASEYIPLDLAYSDVDATTNPPNMWALQLWSGETGPGGSGYFVLYGSDLADIFGSTTASVNCSGVSVSPTYEGPTQVNLYFTIGGSVPEESCTMTATTPEGSSTIPLNVGFPFTDSQHTYPSNPLPQACWVATFFDKQFTLNGVLVTHKGQDLVFNSPRQNPPVGTQVKAMEAGKVVALQTGKPHGTWGSCSGSAPVDYVEIQTGGDSYSTRYIHVTPTVAQGDQVSAGQVIGTIDNSGCESATHLHVQRQPALTSAGLVNFTIPCANPTPVNQYDDGSGVLDDDADAPL